MKSRTELAEVIANKTMRIVDVEKLKEAVAAYLIENNMLNELEVVMRDVMNLRAKNGYVEATAVSAYGLSSSVRTALTEELKNAYPNAVSFHLNEKVDPSVVGGVRLEMVNQELDLTVRAKLNQFKRLTAARES